MMKHIFRIMVLSLCVAMNTACSKEDDADAFVGTYSVSTIENATWGGWSGTLTDNGSLLITKVSNNRVRTSGYFNTFGSVVGNCLYLESYTSSDSSGSLTIVFGTGILNGTVITLSSSTSGSLKYQGVSYPFHSTSSHTCIKQ